VTQNDTVKFTVQIQTYHIRKCSWYSWCLPHAPNLDSSNPGQKCASCSWWGPFQAPMLFSALCNLIVPSMFFCWIYLFFSSQKQPPSWLSPTEIDAESALMQSLAEVEEDEQLDDGVIEILSGEEYNGWYKYVRPHKAAGPATLCRRVLGGPIRDHFIYVLFGEAIVHYAMVCKNTSSQPIGTQNHITLCQIQYLERQVWMKPSPPVGTTTGPEAETWATPCTVTTVRGTLWLQANWVDNTDSCTVGSIII